MPAPLKITEFDTYDLRFPTSLHLDGSDAMNPDPDYSAAYVVLRTNSPQLSGYGMTFTIGRGNELCVQAIISLASLLVDQPLDSLMARPVDLYRKLTADSQLRWVGPEKGVLHLAAAAVIKHTNACGAACGKDLADAFERAWSGDPLAAFGGVVIANEKLTRDSASDLVQSGRADAAALSEACAVAPQLNAARCRAAFTPRSLH